MQMWPESLSRRDQGGEKKRAGVLAVSVMRVTRSELRVALRVAHPLRLLQHLQPVEQRIPLSALQEAGLPCIRRQRNTQ